jgi:Alcohol dehydrogenase GroES-like domain
MAIGINRAESMWRQDDYIEPVKFPAGLGYEAAGVVDAVGRDVAGIAVGDAVNVIPSFSMNQYTTLGLNAHYALPLGLLGPIVAVRLGSGSRQSAARKKLRNYMPLVRLGSKGRATN